MNEVFSVFTSWEELIKARQPKGLGQWESLSSVSSKLSSKKKSDISYTCAHPSHKGANHILGSVLGNLHFLMGYANPGFCLADYHWFVIDPTLPEDEDVSSRAHPSNPVLWRNAELGLIEEGDVVDGEPHPTVAEDINKKRKLKESKTVKFGFGTYTFVPAEGLVYSSDNNRVYRWDIVKDSFLAAKNPELIEYMASMYEEEAAPTEKALPEVLLHACSGFSTFDDEVYPLVKALFPQPGSVVPLSLDTDELVYGVITNKSINFYDRDGAKLKINVYDKLNDSLDLTVDGDTYSSILYNFGLNYLGLNKSELDQYAMTPNNADGVVLKSLPSPGFEGVDGTFEEMFSKEVVYEDSTFKLLVNK